MYLMKLSFNLYMGNTIGLGRVFFCPAFNLGGCKGERVDLGRMGSKCDWGTLYKIPK